MPVTTTAKQPRVTTSVRVRTDVAAMLKLVAQYAGEPGADVLDRLLRGPLAAQFDQLPAAFKARHKHLMPPKG